MFYGLVRETLDQIAAYTKSVKPGQNMPAAAPSPVVTEFHSVSGERHK